MLSFLFMHYSDLEPIASRNGHLFASGPLAQALSDQLASTGSAGAPVQMGISFRDKRGNYCRTFALSDASALAGLACHDGDGWRVDVLARAEGGGADAAAAQYRPAASAMPKAVLQTVEERIAGEPLDARGEAAARGSGWTATR
jgi:hypothetical protein